MFKKLFFITIFSLSCLWLPISVQALSTGGVGGYPANPDPGIKYSESWFIYNLDLGESKEDALVIFNTTEKPQTMKLYVVDSIPSNQGNFALKKEDESREGVGAWIELSEELVTLQPGEDGEFKNQFKEYLQKNMRMDEPVKKEKPKVKKKKSTSSKFFA